jgi:hypothetical protein
MTSSPHPEPGQEVPPNRDAERRFHPWRLLGVIGLVMVVLAGIAAAVDILVLGW